MAWADEGNNTSSSSSPLPTHTSDSSSFYKNNAAPSHSGSSRHDAPPTLLPSGATPASSEKYSPRHPQSKEPLISMHSGVSPSYTNTADSPVYRHVIPVMISSNKTKEERVVNSALSAKRDSSPRPWQASGARDLSPVAISASRTYSSPARIAPSSQPVNASNAPGHRDSEASVNNGFNEKRLYGGSSIPSKVFQQLQHDYSNESSAENYSNPNVRLSRSMTPSSPRITEVHIPRIMQQLHLDQEHHVAEGDPYRNGVLETASAKESVLEELTSQFDPQTNLKKPRAAPGRVFRYLQQQYDDPQDSDFASTDSLSTCRNKSDTISPSNACLSPSASSEIDSGHYEIEPKPYDGGRIPGRTFRLLQENIGTHPSVLQARK